MSAITKTNGNGSAIATSNGMTAEQVNLIKKTVAKDASDDELGMFLHLAKTYDLDPFAKEIWFIKFGGKATIFTSRDGYLKIANGHPAMEGLVSDVVRTNDTLVRTPEGVSHQYGNPRGEITGAYALVFRSDRKFPTYYFADYSEYRGNTDIWKKYASAMILKVAEAMALKRAFSISGLVTREEMDVEQEQPASTPKVVDMPTRTTKPKSAQNHGAELWAFMQEQGHTKDSALTVLGQYGLSTFADMDGQTAKRIQVDLEAMAQPVKAEVAPPEVDMPF